MSWHMMMVKITTSATAVAIITDVIVLFSVLNFWDLGVTKASYCSIGITSNKILLNMHLVTNLSGLCSW